MNLAVHRWYIFYFSFFEPCFSNLCKVCPCLQFTFLVGPKHFPSTGIPFLINGNYACNFSGLKTWETMWLAFYNPDPVCQKVPSDRWNRHRLQYLVLFCIITGAPWFNPLPSLPDYHNSFWYACLFPILCRTVSVICLKYIISCHILPKLFYWSHINVNKSQAPKVAYRPLYLLHFCLDTLRPKVSKHSVIIIFRSRSCPVVRGLPWPSSIKCQHPLPCKCWISPRALLSIW